MSQVEASIQEKFKCAKCEHDSCQTKEVAMSGTGLSKMFDVQHNHFLFVSCEQCGYTEVYNPSILEGKQGKMGSILDVIFG
ncbi:zinc ribbon domain-containing protein [Tuberibacillus sp. Marseille-P3662]|uniref:zinc ribbon domain-containing protein n=1 Tax=Tuberibacillus sp. Marseille-P3662 TaxID=1965358 RepID=UPI000A1CC934|nr:zinc ribbon domain-containing protein [Tuberibacillus sp. Marseille-P3662]